MAGLRFLVAMGVGGEWAVASAMVAEVFPKRARAWSGAIFHGSSVFGTYLAVFAGAFIVGNPNFGWRWGFAIGALPALLTLWIRWRAARTRTMGTGSSHRRQGCHSPNREDRRTLPLAAPARHAGGRIAGSHRPWRRFGGVHIYGKDLMRRNAEQRALAAAGVPETADDEAKKAVTEAEENKRTIKNREMIGMFLTTTGGGLGLLMFGPLCELLGRRGAFLLYHLGGLAAGLALFRFFSDAGDSTLLWALPIFGFLTLGMHAGYAIYFPELFPTRLRGTGGGFCFNVGRILAAPILILSGWMQKDWKISLEDSASLLSLLYLLALVVLIFARETKGRDLPE